MKIYTKTGDDGTTALFSGKRVSKSAAVIEAYGTVDELNSWIGYSAVVSKDAEISQLLSQIQHDLHVVCADLATPSDAKAKIERTSNERTQRLEKIIDKMDAELEPLKNFILAGGSELSGRLHIARTVARRAERLVISHASEASINSEIVIYINRLSDLLFVLARIANKRAGVSDIAWDQAK